LLAVLDRTRPGDDGERSVANFCAVTKIDNYVGADEGFAPWLFGICRHVVVDIQRETYRPLPPGLLRSDVDGPGPAEVVLDADEQAQVRAAFARLDPDERELLELRVVGGLSSAEVAAALGKQPGTVRMAQTGFVRAYALLILGGAVTVLGYLLWAR